MTTQDYIDEQTAAYFREHGVLSVLPPETVKQWVRDALQAAKTAQLTALADYQHENGYAALYRDRTAAREQLKEQE